MLKVMNKYTFLVWFCTIPNLQSDCKFSNQYRCWIVEVICIIIQVGAKYMCLSVHIPNQHQCVREVLLLYIARWLLREFMCTESTSSQCYNYTITAWEYDHSKMLYSALCLSPFSYTHTGVVGIFPKILLGRDGKIICFSFS